VAGTISRKNSFIILPHVFVDGDDLGSMLALAMSLRKMDKRVVLFCRDRIPDSFSMVSGLYPIHTEIPDERFEAAILLECSDLSRLPEGLDISGLADTIINIDHHPDNTFYGDVNWVDPSSAAVGEMVFDLIKELGTPMDAGIAVCLYMAILTDTGCFQYSNVTARTHAIISQLMAFPIQVDEISRKIYREMDYEVLQLLGKMLSGSRRSRDGRLVWATLTREMFRKTGAGEENTQHFIEDLAQARGAEVTVLFKEVDNGGGRVKVSLRSIFLPVNEVAAMFGGGGHRQAAGCTLDGPLASARRRLLTAVKALLYQTRNP
jgi:phosphoesterase RecJ-like protein